MKRPGAVWVAFERITSHYRDVIPDFLEQGIVRPDGCFVERLLVTVVFLTQRRNI